MTAPTNPARSRQADILQCPLGPESLVGSWFHQFDDDCPVLQGLVVGEPQPGVYLLQLLDWATGQRTAQRIVKMDRMTGGDADFRFYDTDEQMRQAYDVWDATNYDHEGRI